MNTNVITTLDFDFGETKAGQNWAITNDGVMGGLSDGHLEFTDTTLRFYGTVSLDNNGGFTTVRSPYSTFNMESINTVELRYKSIGHRIGIVLDNDRRFYMPYSMLYLETTNGEWQTLTIQISDFNEYRLGSLIEKGVTKEYLSSVTRIGFIASDKQEGEFEFEIDYLRFK